MTDDATDPGDAWELVLGDMARRRDLGIERYGKGVDPADRSEDWLRHGYEEVLDLAVYLRAAIVRGDALAAEVLALRAERDRLGAVLSRRLYLCERCGGTGRQEAALYSVVTGRYDAPAGACDDCGGDGWLGPIPRRNPT